MEPQSSPLEHYSQSCSQVDEDLSVLCREIASGIEGTLHSEKRPDIVAA